MKNYTSSGKSYKKINIVGLRDKEIIAALSNKLIKSICYILGIEVYG